MIFNFIIQVKNLKEDLLSRQQLYEKDCTDFKAKIDLLTDELNENNHKFQLSEKEVMQNLN